MMKEPEAKTIEQWYQDCAIGEENEALFVRKEKAVAFAEARVKEATDKLKRAVELLMALPPDYYVSNGQVWVQGLGTRREWEDWLMKVNKFLAEAKPK